MTERLVAGVDIGATKAHLRAVAGARVVADVVVPSTGWRAIPGTDGAAWIRELLAHGPPLEDVAALAVGAQGCDSVEQSAELQHALCGVVPMPCLVVNDAQLLVPAAGLADGIGLVSGTGSIAVGHTPDGRLVYAGGWGWLIGDEGSAPDLVRSAVRAVLRAEELADPGDPLGAALVRAFGVQDAGELPPALMRTAFDPGWGVHAPVVFAVAGAGSALARTVVADAGAALADLVTRLRRRGVKSVDVVAGGSVVTRQPLLQQALRASLAASAEDARLTVLDVPPVEGAVALARELLRSR